MSAFIFFVSGSLVALLFYFFVFYHAFLTLSSLDISFLSDKKSSVFLSCASLWIGSPNISVVRSVCCLTGIGPYISKDVHSVGASTISDGSDAPIPVEVTGEDTSNEWLEPVDDEAYSKL